MPLLHTGRSTTLPSLAPLPQYGSRRREEQGARDGRGRGEECRSADGSWAYYWFIDTTEKLDLGVRPCLFCCCCCCCCLAVVSFLLFVGGVILIFVVLSFLFCFLIRVYLPFIIFFFCHSPKNSTVNTHGYMCSNVSPKQQNAFS